MWTLCVSEEDEINSVRFISCLSSKQAMKFSRKEGTIARKF